MTSVTINANRLTADGKLHGSAAPDGSLLPILLGRMDVSMVADGTDLLNSAADVPNVWKFDHSNSTLKKYTDGAGDPYVRAVYPDMSGGGTATPSINFYFNNLEAPQEFYFQFYARRNGATLGGSKFVKAHDKNDGISPYSNVTWNNGYGSSDISSIAFGNGATPTNDNAFALWYETGHDDTSFLRTPSVPANVRTTSIVHGTTWSASDWGDGTQWHKWQMRIKANTGTSPETEINDGLFEVFVNGVLKLGAYNIFNRGYGSAPFGYLEFMSLSQAPAAAFTLEMKKITISKNGWID